MKKQRIILNILFFLVLSFSLYKIVISIVSNNENNKIYNNIRDNTKIEGNTPEAEESSKFLDVDFSNLLTENNETKGWIKFNEIDYPFVQAKNNEYYLTKSFNNKYNINGTIFMDYRNNGFNDNNTVIYGHNSNDNQMFGSLKKILDNNYFANNGNDIIKISTIEANYNYKIFSVYVIEKEDYYIITSFGEKEFEKFIKTIKNRSRYKINEDVNINDKILTLSTCNGYSGTSKRLVVHAKLIETKLR